MGGYPAMASRALYAPTAASMRHRIGLFGDTYEYLISHYAANVRRSGGEFFTPRHVSRLIAQLTRHKQTRVNKIYGPTRDPGSLLPQAKKHFDAIVFNPPYSVKSVSGDPTLANDDRFAPAAILARKPNSDFAFVLHSLSYLSAQGARSHRLRPRHLLSARSFRKHIEGAG